MTSGSKRRPDPVGTPVTTAIETQRAVRHLRPDPIPTEVVERLIYAATRAPSGANSQPWEFIAITEPDMRRRLGDIYRSASERVFQTKAAEAADEKSRRIYLDALHLSGHIGRAPLLILLCVRFLKAGRSHNSSHRSTLPLKTYSWQHGPRVSGAC